MSFGDKTPDGYAFEGALNMANTVPDKDPKGARLASGHTVFNVNSVFFTGKINGQAFPGNVLEATSSYYGLSLDEIRELAVLHELFHLGDTTGAHEDHSGDPAKDIPASKAINKLIREKCGFP